MHIKLPTAFLVAIAWLTLQFTIASPGLAAGMRFRRFLVRGDKSGAGSRLYSPSYYRVNGVVPNVDAFYETFDVKEGDGHYLASEDRVRIWR
jgi:hypothetical protein